MSQTKFSMQDVIQNALNNAKGVGNTLNTNLELLQKQQDPLLKEVGNQGSLLMGNTTQGAKDAATEDAGMLTGQSEMDAAAPSIDFLTGRAANVASTASRQALRKVAQAHSDAMGNAAVQPGGMQAGFAQIPGKPLPAITKPNDAHIGWHGTSKDTPSVSTSGNFGQGTYFFPNKPNAESWAPNVFPIETKNLKHLDDKQYSQLYEDALDSLSGGQYKNADSLDAMQGINVQYGKQAKDLITKQLQDAGHDGVFIHRANGGEGVKFPESLQEQSQQ